MWGSAASSALLSPIAGGISLCQARHWKGRMATEMMLMMIRAMIWITEVAARVSAQAMELGRGGSGLVAMIDDADVPGLILAMIMAMSRARALGR